MSFEWRTPEEHRKWELERERTLGFWIGFATVIALLVIVVFVISPLMERYGY